MSHLSWAGDGADYSPCCLQLVADGPLVSVVPTLRPDSRGLAVLAFPAGSVAEADLRAARPISPLLRPQAGWELPAHVESSTEHGMIVTNDESLADQGLPQFPPLPGDTDEKTVEEIRRTVSHF